MQVLTRPPSGMPALVLNADFRPLSYYPLSLWPWQEVIKAVFLDRVDVVATYDQVVHSPSFEMRLPSVVSLQQYVPQERPPAFLLSRVGAALCGLLLYAALLAVIRPRGLRVAWRYLHQLG